MVGNRAPETPRAEQQSQQPTAYAQERPVSFGAAPYATEQAPQPVYMPQQERSAPITNEQRTVTPYTEQSRTPAPVVERPAPGAHPQEAALAPQPEAPVPVSAEADQQNREAENKIHTVESSWHRVQVENGTNRIVEGQPEGRALIEEKRAESNPRAASDDDNQDQQQDAAGAAGTSMYQQPLPGAVAPMIASGQIGYPRELASGQVDYEHRLDPPRNPVVTALASPLLWVGIVVLVLAFFAAAFL
jgi:hypothetical protein